MSQQTQATAILGLLTETSLHAGAGSTVGIIDLPIQREAHTGYPCIFGSSVKGPLRTLAEQQWAEDKSLVEEIFGPDVEESKKADGFHAGALAVSDARLLLLPVRSLTSHFKWVTCPAILRRWQADGRRLQMTGKEEFPIPDLSDDLALVASAPSNKSASEVDLFLEEFRFKTKVDENHLKEMITQIASLMGRADAVTALEKQLTVVSDDMFSHLAKYATPVNAHIALDYEKKTVKTGALWYEETLPPDTLLYVTLMACNVRKSGEVKNAEGVLTCVKALFGHPYLQLGGNETVGMGWCKVTVLTHLTQEVARN